ncbi:zinc finger protein 474-like isoform X1 [Lytechinus pictus]|uniref:zinc finger protein 474-like isoform X1 n=1 Tax=Lytechinus pictus TaxID=7653 RepID=UPI0030BA0A00
MPGALRPVAVVCYICGREFGSKSIGIHEPQCMKKWKAENSKLPKHQRRPLPRKPEVFPSIGGTSSQDIERFNQAALKSSQAQLLPCPNCGRTFLPDRLPVHQKSCKGGNAIDRKKLESVGSVSRSWSGPETQTPRPPSTQERPGTATLSRPSSVTLQQRKHITIKPVKTPVERQQGNTKGGVRFQPTPPPQPKSQSTSTAQASSPRKPQTVICYICGREFGSKSISIHEPQCMQKWKLQNSQLPKHLRRPPPKKPQGLGQGQAMGADAEAYNAIASQSASSQLAPCSNCGRTFSLNRIEKHESICSVKSGAAPSRGKTPSGGNHQISTSKSGSGTQNFQPSPPSKPRTLVCYICGREFGSKSLPIHEPQCLEKWKVQNGKLPRELRKPLPRKPVASGGSSGNDAAWDAAKANLVACRNCGRTFNPDRIEKHRSVCRPKTGTVVRPKTATLNIGKENQMKSSKPRTPKTPIPRRPPTVVCYLCGREFGSKSISIHEPQCIKKWHIENDKLPKKLRRPEPVKPVVTVIPTTGNKSGDYNLDALNDAAWKASQANLAPCGNCGRTFLPDRLLVHQRSCKPKKQSLEAP